MPPVNQTLPFMPLEALESLDVQALKEILVFLCSIPPETNLRLMLQLALAAYIPPEQREALFNQLQSDRPLEKLLLEDGILTQILAADGELSDAEDNTLFEAMDLMGLVVPSDLSGAQVLMDELSKGLMLGSA
ncbi:MAG: hypothetical protein AAGE59_10360 [Cyanobacteria bacterium P01_F01_bin.86]